MPKGKSMLTHVAPIVRALGFALGLNAAVVYCGTGSAQMCEVLSLSKLISNPR